MRTPVLIGLAMALTGCTSINSCGVYGLWADQEQCRQEQLLYQNDLLQSKILITSGNKEGLELASALLNRLHSQHQDQRGEVPFYRALLGIRQNPANTADIIQNLEQAAAAQHPHAVALLYRIYSEPYLIKTRDAAKADHYRQAYSQLDVARSGYPSFEQALAVTKRLFAVPVTPTTPAKPSPVAPAPKSTPPAPTKPAATSTPNTPTPKAEPATSKTP